MADTLGSHPLLLDPNSLLLSHCSNPLNPKKNLQLITDSYIMERGPRYIEYAQLRESKLQFKRLKFDEDEQVPEIPTSEISPVKKAVRFQENSTKQGYSIVEEDEQVLVIPQSDFSPLKKSVRFQGNSKNHQGFADEQVSQIPRSEFSPLKKSVSFQGKNKKQGYSDEQVSEIPRSEFSPMKKSVRFQGNSRKQGYLDDQVSEIPRSEFSPIKKSVRIQGNVQGKKQGYSVLAQSVPDFSSAIRKENRKPSENRIPKVDKSATPPPSLSKRDKLYGSAAKSGVGGSKSVNSGEKQSGGKLMMMGRKSYASIDELKGLSIAASSAINGENRGAKKGGNVLRKSTVFSTRYY